MNLFAKATRMKLRFDTPKGQISVEDLWDAHLTSETGKPNLNDIAVGLHNQLKSAETVSFVTPAAPKDEELQLKLDVVKAVIEVRVAERDAAVLARKKAETKQKLLEALAKKQDEEINAKSADELQAMIDAL